MVRWDISVADYQFWTASNTVLECIKGAFRKHEISLKGNGCRRKLTGILENQKSYRVI